MAPSCQEAGVLGVLCGVIGALQATEAIKVLLGKGKTLAGRELHFDALAMKFREFKRPRDPKCPVCGDGKKAEDIQLIDYRSSAKSGTSELPTTTFAFANGAGSAPRDEARDFALGIDGFRYGDLYEPERLAALDARFRAELAAGDAGAGGALRGVPRRRAR